MTDYEKLFDSEVDIEATKILIESLERSIDIQTLRKSYKGLYQKF